MKRNYFLSLSATALLISTLILGLPIFLSGGSLEAICTLPKASAQDNPCLAQEATNSALQLQLQQVSFQATLDTINFQSTLTATDSEEGTDYQATITALEGKLSTGQSVGLSPTSIPPLGFPFEENFSTNQRGWDFTPRSAGVARLSQGQLLITTNPQQLFYQVIPSLEASDEFFIQARVTVPDIEDAFVGFGLGNFTLGQFHMFLSGREWWSGVTSDDGAHVVMFYDNLSEIFITSYDRLWADNETFVLGLESSGGLYTLYINGVATETTSVNPYGTQLALILYYPGTYYDTRSAFWDDISIREARQ